MKKEYNPFKMWGSYIGIVIGFIANPLLNFIPIAKVIAFDLSQNLSITYGAFFGIIFGFFIGWGIHSLIRKNS